MSFFDSRTFKGFMSNPVGHSQNSDFPRPRKFENVGHYERFLQKNVLLGPKNIDIGTNWGIILCLNIPVPPKRIKKVAT